MSQPGYEDYAVGWICAIKNEEIAAKAMLDEVHDHSLLQPRNDSNVYIRGRIGKHNVVIACLPAGKLGPSSAAITANNMFRTFTELRFSLLVGVGGGVPGDGLSGTRLGDIVVSIPRPKHPAVVQYDHGKTGDDGFVRTHHLNGPPRILLNAINRLQTEHSTGKYGYLHYMSNVLASVRLALRLSDQNIAGPSTPDLPSSRVLYGTITSGSQLMTSAVSRDTIANEIDALCFEMEAAGVMDDFKCLVIRGICDNSDSAKTKEWQGRAALAAAAYAKELLGVVEPEQSLALVSESKTETTTSLVQKPSGSFFVFSREIIEWTSVDLGRLVIDTHAPWGNFCPFTPRYEEKDIGIVMELRVQEILEETKGTPIHQKFLTALSRFVGDEDILGVMNSLSCTEKTYILPNAALRFKEGCKDPRVRQWLTDMIQYDIETYMVVGIHTLSTPAIRQTTAQLSTSASVVTQGEVIVAIQYRKVKNGWFWRNSVDTAFLDLANVWAPALIIKGPENDQDEIVQVMLQDHVTASDYTDEGEALEVNGEVIVL